VKITGPDGQAVAEDVTGDVQIRGGNVTHGYYQNDAANAQAFTGDGWLKTGDTGFVHQGELIITGRSKEIIFVNGQNYFPHDLESIALLSPQLELGKVAAFGITQDVAVESALLMFVLFRGDLKEFIAIDREITSLVGEHLGLEVTHVIPVKRIPKTTSGKIQRSVLARQYLDGDFDGVLKQLAQLQEPSPSRIRQPDNSVEQQLLAICHNVIQDKIPDLHTNLFEVGISSLALTEIHEQIDNAFPGKLEVDDLFEHPTLSALAELVKSRQ
jgi:aryl carrier-like protein